MRIRRAFVVRLALAMALVILSLNFVIPINAAGVVSTCNLANLNTALAGGGTVFFTCSGTINVSPTITIAADTKIDATGQSVTLSGGNANPVFIINSGATLSLVNITVANGLAVSSSNGGGGAVNNGTLNIVNSTFSNNASPVAFAGLGGGGVLNSGTLNIINSTFSGNTANNPGNGGGAIFNDGAVTIVNSTFSGNSAIGAGALFNHNGSALIVNSTFSSNSAVQAGAIISGMPMTIVNSTFSNNQATDSGFGVGGGIANEPSATLNVVNSTFASNIATAGGGGLFNNGIANVVNSTFVANSTANPSGGGAISNYGGTLNLAASTFAGNLASGGVGGVDNQSIGSGSIRNTIVTNSTTTDCGSGLSGSNNLSGGTCPATLAAVTGLAALANNGGPTQTNALNTGSNAIDNVSTCTDTSGAALTTDQRGLRRPINTTCDIGAYESGVVNITFTPTVLPLASLGVPYSAPITVTGGTGPYTFTLSSVPLATFSGLPASVTLSAGGTLSGTPTSLGLSIFTVRATDSTGAYADWTYGVIVLPPSPTLSLSPLTLPAGNIGSVYNQTITASGGSPAYSFAVTGGTLPPGLTLSGAGVLSGTPTSTGTFNFTVTATDASLLTGSQDYTVTIGTALSTPLPGFTPNAVIGAFDPAISKIGVLQAGGSGLAGEKLTWTITVFNQGTALGSNVSVVDTLPNNLRVDSADASQGTFTISGQTVTFSIGALNPGQTVTLHVVTTVLTSAASTTNTACVSAATAFAAPNPRCSSAPALPATRLPSTGYPPTEPPSTWLLIGGVGLLLLVAGAATVLLGRRHDLAS